MSDEGEDGHLQHTKVVIIGAGIAGIAAGSCLANAGITDFVILEATDRIGGRIQSVDLETHDDKKAELGANWIHGIDRNPIYKLAVHNNLLPQNFQGRKLGQKHMFRTADGEPVNAKIVEEVDWVYGLLMSQVEEFYQDQMPTPYENDSVGAFVEREFEMRMSHYHGEDLKTRMAVLQQRLLNESIINGCDSMHDVALSDSGAFEELPGVHYIIPPGFEAVCKVFTRNIPSDRMLLNHPVSQVNWQLPGGNANGNHAVCVECQNGKKFYADHVIVTCSLGYLKKSAARMFTPTLPEFKLSAIENMAIGTVDKIVLEFDTIKPILPEGVKRLELILDRHQKDPQEKREKWYEKISFFEAIADNVLIAWLCGDEAEHMEQLTDNEVGKDVVQLLKSTLKCPNIPPLKRIISSKWKSSQYQQGSYSYIPVGSSVEDVENMGKPVCDEDGKPLILFAGEATHPTFYSSSHGALLSGEREAQRLQDLYIH